MKVHRRGSKKVQEPVWKPYGEEPVVHRGDRMWCSDSADGEGEKGQQCRAMARQRISLACCSCGCGAAERQAVLGAGTEPPRFCSRPGCQAQKPVVAHSSVVLGLGSAARGRPAMPRLAAEASRCPASPPPTLRLLAAPTSFSRPAPEKAAAAEGSSLPLCSCSASSSPPLCSRPSSSMPAGQIV